MRETIPGYRRVDTLDAALGLLDEWIAYGLRMKLKYDGAHARAEQLRELVSQLPDPVLHLEDEESTVEF